MSIGRLISRSLRLYWRTGIVVAFGIAVATAVITGSLVIGDSVTGSLRETALSRLGNISYAAVASGYFRAKLADKLAADDDLKERISQVVAGISTTGAARNPATEATVPAVNVLGIDADFWEFYGRSSTHPGPRECLVNEALADDLGISAGDPLIVTMRRDDEISSDLLFAERSVQNTAPTMRLTVTGILPTGGADDFRLDAQNAIPRNVFIDREWLATRNNTVGKANMLLVATTETSDETAQRLQAALATYMQLADYGLKMQMDPASGSVSLTSGGTVLTSSQVAAAQKAADDAGTTASISSVYLATNIEQVDKTERKIAYAMVASIAPAGAFSLISGHGQTPQEGEIWLNAWAAEDLTAQVGDRVRLTYMLPTLEGEYPTADMDFTVGAIVKMSGPAADKTLVPNFPGITEADTVDDWDAPFPVDLNRITNRDEAYWDLYKALPKAFVTPNAMQKMWQSGQTSPQADWVTSVRFAPTDGKISDAAESIMTTRLLTALDPAERGLVFRPVRENALQASKGTSDFSQLFLGLSMFLVFSGAGLGGMLLRLSLDRRASQAGIMLATGCTQAQVNRAFFAEGTALTIVGTVIGIPAGVLYASGVIHALANWWSGALGATANLWLHVDISSLITGAVAGLVVGMGTVWASTRRISRAPVLSLLSGRLAMDVAPTHAPRHGARYTLWGSVALAIVLGILALTGAIEPAGAFFGIGATLLVGGLAGARLGMYRIMAGRGAYKSMHSLASRNAVANAGRSLLVVGLLASAIFVIVAVAANTRDLSAIDTSDRNSGTGGFQLQAISSVPPAYDIATPAGRANLGFSAEDEKAFDGVEIVGFLASPGEDISCLNISRPTYPRLLGVPEKMRTRGGFRLFTMGGREPWDAIDLEVDDLPHSIPTLGDEASVRWTLHSSLEKVYTMPGPDGEPLYLRFTGLLKGSIFQSELLISEARFRKIYPSITRPSYFLIATPQGREEQVAQILRANIGDNGLEVRKTSEVLNGFLQVQNTYLSMFLALGGLGLLLGTVGMITILLRGIFERRAELALMEAIGFTRRKIAGVLLIEHVTLLVTGMALGTLSALIAVSPQTISAESAVNWGVLTAVISGILLFSIVSCITAVLSSLRGSLIYVLRQE